MAIACFIAARLVSISGDGEGKYAEENICTFTEVQIGNRKLWYKTGLILISIGPYSLVLGTHPIRLFYLPFCTCAVLILSSRTPCTLRSLRAVGSNNVRLLI